MNRLLAVLLLAAVASPAAAAAPDPATPAGLEALVRLIDDRQRNQGDWKALCYTKNG